MLMMNKNDIPDRYKVADDLGRIQLFLMYRNHRNSFNDIDDDDAIDADGFDPFGHSLFIWPFMRIIFQLIQMISLRIRHRAVEQRP